MGDASLHWNRRYSKEWVRPNPDDPVTAAALEHFGDVANCRLLDLGCGTGAASLFFADRGASVVSIDTSEVAINSLKAYCAAHGISNITPIRMSAENIAEVGRFDFIFGAMVLHHIEPFDYFAFTLRAALRPEGKAFFYENNATSSLLMWFREHVVGKLWVPKGGDEEESPLAPGEIEILDEHFRVEVVYPWFAFFRLISPYLLRDKGLRPLQWLDDVIYRVVPRFRRYSYRQYILLS